MSVASRPPEWIPLDGAVNARTVVPGVLLRSDNLQDLSERDVRVLVDEQGLEVVLDLRTGVEVELEGPGPMTAEPAVRIKHHSLHPESGQNTDLEADTVKPWGTAEADLYPAEPGVVRSYMGYLRHRPDSVVSAIRTIAETPGAVLVHCAAGKDRTGVIVALAQDAVGVDRTAIVNDYLATVERIELIFARLTASPTYRAELEGQNPRDHAPRPGTMERVLELVDEEFGGSRAWLLEHGLSVDELAALERRVRARAG